MSFRDDILPDLDAIRGIPGELGLRRHSVKVRVRTHSGARPGLVGSSSTDVDTPLLVGNGTQSPKVTEINVRDVVASGGLYEAGDYRIGPVTHEWSNGGTSLDTTNPATTSVGREVFYIIEGPGFATGGAVCKRVSDESLPNFHINIVVRRMGAP